MLIARIVEKDNLKPRFLLNDNYFFAQGYMVSLSNIINSYKIICLQLSICIW